LKNRNFKVGQKVIVIFMIWLVTVIAML